MIQWSLGHGKRFWTDQTLGGDLGIFWYIPQIHTRSYHLYMGTKKMHPTFTVGEAVLSACAVPAWCLALDLAEDGAEDVLSFNAAAWRR